MFDLFPTYLLSSVTQASFTKLVSSCPSQSYERGTPEGWTTSSSHWTHSCDSWTREEVWSLSRPHTTLVLNTTLLTRMPLRSSYFMFFDSREDMFTKSRDVRVSAQRHS